MDESKRGWGKEADQRGVLFPSPTSTLCTYCDQTLSLVGSNFISLFFFRKYYCLMMSLKNVLIVYYINVSKYCFTVFTRLNTYLAFGEIESQFSELCRLQSCTEIFFIILE